jgi:hypothetical protein
MISRRKALDASTQIFLGARNGRCTLLYESDEKKFHQSGFCVLRCSSDSGNPHSASRIARCSFRIAAASKQGIASNRAAICNPSQTLTASQVLPILRVRYSFEAAVFSARASVFSLQR